MRYFGITSLILCGILVPVVGQGGSLTAGPVVPSRGADDQPLLRVDPLLVAQAAEVWGVLARKENPVWPGWDATATPLLFYLPDVQDVLINHPRPPQGFHKYTGPVQFPGATIMVRDGHTFFQLDGQNTVVDVAGVPTLVVADTLSNRRNTLRGLLEDPRPAREKVNGLTWRQLQGDPYQGLCMIAHEAFHAFQRRQAPDKPGSEAALARYPVLTVANTVGFALEGGALAEMLRARHAPDIRRHALRWLAARQERRRHLPAEAIAYEDFLEYLEGLAKYVEYRLLEVLEGRTPTPPMAWVQGFQGYGDLSKQREELIRQMVQNMRGEVNINNDPYGVSPLRMRLYFSGMAVGVLLDRLAPDWKQRIFAREETLTRLATQALKPTQEELAAALAALQAEPGYAPLVERKTQLQQEGAKATDALVQAIQTGPHTTVVIDYAALGDLRIGMSYTPFGVLRVDDHRTIYRLVPISAHIGTCKLRQTTDMPLLHDRAARKLSCQLQETLTPQRLEQLLGSKPDAHTPILLNKLNLPGVELDGGQAVLQLQHKTLTVRLLPGKK